MSFLDSFKRFDATTFDLPKFDLPKFDLPTVDAQAGAQRVATFARDAAYVGVGAVVMLAQQVDERRRGLTDAMTDAANAAAESATAQVRRFTAAAR